ncbi:MAG: glycosyltransferase, partial [Acidobacteriota bacterium]
MTEGTSWDFTVLMPARNAAETVVRALRSLRDPAIREIILIDDCSEDETRSLAQDLGDPRLRIVSPRDHRNLATVRNRGLKEVGTAWLIWCDADDTFAPDRVSQLAATLQTTGADCATDGVRLFDGPSGRFVRDLPIPDFLRDPSAACRLFERNYLPSVGHLALRTALARALLYDEEMNGGDDYDFALRLVRAGARFAFSSRLGYCMHAYPGSDSRSLSRQNDMVSTALGKHSYADVRSRYRRAGYSHRVTAWGLCSMAIFRREFETALEFLEQGHPPGASDSEILEPEGPNPYAEGWRSAFTRGTLLLLLEQWHNAIPCLERAFEIRPSAEGANNLGVALGRNGRNHESQGLFEMALEL